jgi:Tfp pilus assembly protein PilF
MERQQSDERAARLEHYLHQDPGNASLRADLIDHLIGAGRLDEAKAHALVALRGNPADHPTRYRLAVIEHHAGRLEAARDELSRLLDEGITEQNVRLELARVQAALGNLQAALVTLDQLAAQPMPEALAPVVALLHVRTLHWAGEIDAAITRAERHLQLQPDTPPVVSALATLYIDARRMADAARLFEAAQAAGNADTEMLAVGGFLALDAADVAVAQQRFEDSVARTPRLGRAQLGLGLTYAATGRSAEAKQALHQATRAMPTHLGSWHALAWMQLLDGEIEAAEQSFNSALAANRKFGDTYGGLAIIAAMRQDRASAERLIRTGERLDRASLNVAVARVLLQHKGAMHTPQFLDSALKMLHQQALSPNPEMRTMFERLLRSRVAVKQDSR